MSPALLTVRQVADSVGVGEPRIRLEINQGRLLAVKLGVSIRVRPEDLAEWIKCLDPAYIP
jgi:excisionase family DNA binding protein